VPLAVNVVAVATPDASVVAMVVFVPFANVPLAPLLGAVNVTGTPLTGLLALSFTITDKSVPNAVLVAALCEDPPVAVIEAGVPEPTVIVFEIPVIVLVRVSVAVMVWLPAVFNVAENVPLPFVSVVFGGKVALASVEVKCTVPV